MERGHFLIIGKWRQSQRTMGSVSPRLVALGYIRKAFWTNQKDEVSTQHSTVVSDLLPAPGSCLNSHCQFPWSQTLICKPSNPSQLLLVMAFIAATESKLGQFPAISMNDLSRNLKPKTRHMTVTCTDYSTNLSNCPASNCLLHIILISLLVIPFLQ